MISAIHGGIPAVPETERGHCKTLLGISKVDFLECSHYIDFLVHRSAVSLCSLADLLLGQKFRVGIS